MEPGPSFPVHGMYIACTMPNWPRRSNSIDIPCMAVSGSRSRSASVRARLPPIAISPVSVCRACGRYCLRTGEFAPSAPTSRSPVASSPSSKCAVTRPSSWRVYPVHRLSKRITSSMPVNRTWRSVIRLTLWSRSSGRSPLPGISPAGIPIRTRNRSVYIV